MTVFIIGLVLGAFLGAFATSKEFRTKIITGIKRLVESNKNTKRRRAK